MSKILCPRCKIPMTLNIEVSNTAEGKRINYFYRCKNCGYRLDDAIMIMRKTESGYDARIVEYIK